MTKADSVYRVELVGGPYDGHCAWYTSEPPAMLEFSQVDEARDEQNRPMPGCEIRRVSRYVRKRGFRMIYWPNGYPFPADAE